MTGMVFTPIIPIAGPSCKPTSATAGMIGCWPQVNPSTVTSSDYFDIWQPGPFPASANLVSIYGLFAAPPPIGTSTTPAIGWLQAIGISDLLGHTATVRLEFPSFATFAAYKPSVITTALAWAGAPVVAHTAGYYAAGDGGSATYIWNSSSAATADGLFIITATASSGRWILEVSPSGVGALQLGVIRSPAISGAVSTDAKLNAALTACSTYSATINFPTGFYLIDGTGALTSVLQSCHLKGSGVIAGIGSGMGTMFLLTSTSVKPFSIGSAWSISDGVNFYWPNQVATGGTVAYPALMTIDQNSSNWWMDHVNIINAYDGIVKGTSGGTGSWYITNSWLWTQNDTFRLPFVGDSVHLNGVTFDPGNWLQICNFSPSCEAAIDARHNTTFNVIDLLNLSMDNTIFFAWDNMFKLASTGVVGLSNSNMEFDGVATVIDASAGGLWSGLNILSGAGDCHRWNYATSSNSGHAPCFTMGANPSTELHLANLKISDASGSFIISAGTNVRLEHCEIGAIGSAADGGDYYVVHTTANPGGLNVVVQNSVIGGLLSSTKVHGITTDVVASRLVVQGNTFLFLNDDLNTQSAPTTIITGNFSISTQGSASVLNLATGGNPVIWNSNQFDKPPLATISGCGGSPAITGTLSGLITTGTGTVTACTITLPFNLPGPLNGGIALFNDFAAVPLSQAVSGSPPQITVSSGITDIHTHFISWAAVGAQ